MAVQVIRVLGALGALVLTTGAVVAADLKVPVKSAIPPAPLPAVDGINWKFGGLGGSFSDDTIALGTGSVAIPIGTQYGLQIDGAAGTLGGDFLGTVGAHLFWRDPGRGLLGLYGS